MEHFFEQEYLFNELGRQCSDCYGSGCRKSCSGKCVGFLFL